MICNCFEGGLGGGGGLADRVELEDVLFMASDLLVRRIHRMHGHDNI